MSITKKEKSVIQDLGHAFPKTETVRLDLPNIRGQRTPHKDTIQRYVNLAGGFDARMYRKPYVARTTAEKGREWVNSLPANKDKNQYQTGFLNAEGVEDGFFRVLFDGGHRRQLYILLLESKGQQVENATWECDVYDIDDVKTAHEQFTKIQSELQKSLSTDLLFIHRVYAGVKKGSKDAPIIDALEKAGLVVQHEEDVIGEEFRDDFTKSSISFNGMKHILTQFKDKNFEYVVAAVSILKSALSGLQGNQTRMRLNQYLVYGVAQTLQQINGQLSEADRNSLVLEAMNDWIKSTNDRWESALSEEQKKHLLTAHAKVWGSEKLNMSPHSAGVAVTSVVEKFNEAEKRHPELVLDTRQMVVNTINDEKKAKNKKAASLLKVA